MSVDLDVISLMLSTVTLASTTLPRRRDKSSKTVTSVQAVCGCSHDLAMHDPETKRCYAEITRKKYSKQGGHIGFDYVSCPCRQYVGPLPVESFFTTPMLPSEGGTDDRG